MGMGMSADVINKVVDIIAAQALLDPADIKPDSVLGDLGIDSLGLVESIFAIEEEFDISVPFNANDPSAGDIDFSTPASIAKDIQDLIAAKTA